MHGNFFKKHAFMKKDSQTTTKCIYIELLDKHYSFPLLYHQMYIFSEIGLAKVVYRFH